jgi:peptide-methionine (S)-S-oxide reductase
MTNERVENDTQQESVTLAGGCFWCLEAVFDQLAGVLSVESGYMGGRLDKPSYAQVCSGATGHAEVVRIGFDPKQVSFREILDVFFTIHDPTTLDRQGNDVGSQYRSAIFYASAEQRAIAESLIRELGEAGAWPDPIVTQVVPEQTFFPAEGEHEEYYQRNGRQPYCQIVIAPKLANFRAKFTNRLKG